MEYTKSQQRAISSIGTCNLQITACAGSGKTEVLSAGIADLLKRGQQKGLKPANIVAFTFTEKAAGELKERIHDRCKQALGNTQGMAEMYVGTIHGYCLALLQSPPLYKYLKYRVLTDVQQRLLIDRFSKQSGLTSVPLLDGRQLQRWKDSRLYQQVISIVTEEGLPLDSLPDGVGDAVKSYRELIDGHRYLDYPTMLSEAVDALRSNQAVRSALKTTIKHLIVDEYQDVNPMQEALIQEIHALGASLCVVGDDDQTIYQWRGGDVQNIITFSTRYQRVTPIKLNENFRSSSKIVDIARGIVEANTNRLPKKMKGTDAQPFEDGDLLALPFADPDAEARWIATKIKRMRGWEYKDRPDRSPRGLAWADFAILLRSARADAGPIVAALNKEGIPFIVGGMNELFDTAEIQAIRNCFYFLSNFDGPGEAVTKTKVKASLSAGRLGVGDEQVRRGIAFLERQKQKIAHKMIAELYPQPLFQGLLKEMGVREEAIDAAHGAGSGEVVYFNLGKFSQLISDFEQIHFKSRSDDLLKQFAAFLCYQAPDYYPEGWQDAGQARPDAVQIMTVHQAKGMQWPAVFVPCLRRNRFPAKPPGGRTIHHIIPPGLIPARYAGSVEDERRLFYVALTRAERFLFCSWAPIMTNQQQRKVSIFFNEVTESDCVLTRDPKRKPQKTLPPHPRRDDSVLAVSFSELKYYFECAYLFKLRFLYGFDAPISQALGYGKSLHDALAEIHSKAIQGEILGTEDVPRLVDDHLFLPFAREEVRANSEKAASEALSRYLQGKENQANLGRLEHVEKPIELKLADGTVVTGRIDLIRRTDTGEVAIVDFKSDQDAQSEDITMRQLHVYALGYNQLTGQNADRVEIKNLDRGAARREIVDPTLIQDTLVLVSQAGKNLREGTLSRHSRWCKTCATCDLAGICRDSVAKTKG